MSPLSSNRPDSRLTIHRDVSGPDQVTLIGDHYDGGMILIVMPDVLKHGLHKQEGVPIRDAVDQEEPVRTPVMTVILKAETTRVLIGAFHTNISVQSVLRYITLI